MYNDFVPQDKDPHLWQLARRRASFKRHLLTYVLVNAGLWLIWFLPGSRTYGTGIPWPAWSLAGWGIGLLAHYRSAYAGTGADAVEKEYDKLTKKQSR